MASTHRQNIRLDVSFIRNVWVVTIFHEDQTENRSFRKEDDARAYGEARVEELRSLYGDVPLN